MTRTRFIVCCAVLGLLAAPAFGSDLPPQDGEHTAALSPQAQAVRSGERAITVYGGFVSDNKLMRLLLTPWDAELEAGTGYRFGSEKTGEVWTALYARYDNFPWNDRIYTTVAASTGVNYATRVSPIEQTKGRGSTSKLLHYFSPEITFADPRDKDLELVLRLHHRSGVFGLFDGASSGSNIATLGIRRHF